MNKNTFNSMHDCHTHYMDGRRIMIGDRIVFLSNDNAAKIDSGRIIAVLMPGTKESRLWYAQYGGFIVNLDNLGLRVSDEANERVQLVARGNEEDIKRARCLFCKITNPCVERLFRFDRYFSGREIHLGDLVSDNGELCMVEFFIEPNTKCASDYSAPNGGVMLLHFNGGRVLYYTTENFVELTLVHRFNESIVARFEQYGQTCRMFYANGAPICIGDEIEYTDLEGNRSIAQIVTVCPPFTQSAWNEKCPTGGFRVRFDNGEIALFGQMSPTMRLLRRNRQSQ